MARTAEHPSQGRRSRLSLMVAGGAGLLLVLLGLQGLDWRESPAMVAGELIGLIGPPAAVLLAAVALYVAWARSAQR